MSLDIFNDAFKSLSILNENLFDTSTLGVTKLHSFMDDDFEEDTVDIIDPNASTDEELSDSYIGKVIVDCNVCHSHIFKDRDELDIDESGLVNGEDMCPYCGEQEGFVIIGQIEAFNANSEEDPVEEPAEDAVEEVEVEETVDDEDEDMEESMTESLNEGSIGNDLASKVLSYLDKIEARGELTEDANPKNLESTLDSFINIANTVDGNNRLLVISDKFGVVNRIARYCSKELGKKVRHIDAHTLDAMYLDNALNQLQGYDLLIVDRLHRAAPKIQAMIMDATESIPTIFVCEKCGDSPLDSSIIAKCYVYKLTEGLTESMNNVKVETDDSIVTVNSDDAGKVTVTTEPAGAAMPEGEGEMIAPLSDDDMNSIMDADADVPAEGEEIPADIDAIEEPAEDMPLEDEEVDIDMEEIDEESIDNLGESYLKKVYENVDSYKTNSSYMRGDKIIVEGVIKFTSGKEKKTGFILEAKSADNRGRVTFSGYNTHLTNDKSAYLFEGIVTDKKLTLNKLSYRYSLNENLISGRVYRR